MVASAIRGTRYFVELLISATIPNVNIVIFCYNTAPMEIFSIVLLKKRRDKLNKTTFFVYLR